MDIYQSNGIGPSCTEWQLECVSACWTLKCTGVIYFTFKRLDVTKIQMLPKVIVSLKQVYNMMFMIVACQIVCYVDCTTSTTFLYLIQDYLYSAFHETIIAKQLNRKLIYNTIYNIFIYCRSLIYLTLWRNLVNSVYSLRCCYHLFSGVWSSQII